MLVLCTGLIRSGSTWSYNVARLLLARRAPRVHGVYADSPVPVLLHHGLDVDHCVLKCHAPDHDARVLIKHRLCRTIYTYREPIACVASNGDFGVPFKQTLAQLRASFELFQFQRDSGGVHFIWYDDIVSRPRERVHTVASYLELDLDGADIDAVAEMLSYENVRHVIRTQAKSAKQLAGAGLQWDPKTLFNQRHIRDNPSDPALVVSPEQRAAIAQALPEWCDETGCLRPEVRAWGMLYPPDPADTAPAPTEPADTERAAEAPIDDALAAAPPADAPATTVAAVEAVAPNAVA